MILRANFRGFRGMVLHGPNLDTFSSVRSVRSIKIIQLAKHATICCRTMDIGLSFRVSCCYTCLYWSWSQLGLASFMRQARVPSNNINHHNNNSNNCNSKNSNRLLSKHNSFGSLPA